MINIQLEKQSLKDVLNQYPIQEQFNIISSLQNILKEVNHEINQEVKENYVYCDNCKEYFKKDSLNTESELKTESGVCVYRDCGYGDDDVYADVTYHYVYYVCPKCNKHIIKNKYYINENNRRSRWE